MPESVPSPHEMQRASVPAESFPSRRQLREAQRGSAKARPAIPVAPEMPAPLAAPLHATPRRRRSSPLRATVTVAAIGALFGVMALPAYASVPVPEEAAEALVAGLEPVPVAEAVSTLRSQSLQAGSASVAIAARDGFGATSPEDLAARIRDQLRAANNEAYNKSGARELGDDYPWFYELSYNQGGGLSPLNYYYRECVDFVAWRLNRDAGYTQAPFKWVWSNLTPTGGNASQWLYAWESKGWPVSDKPEVGSVAYFYGNHVAYVSKVNSNGTVLIEEYNWGRDNTYGQRTVSVDEIAAFLHVPS